MLFLLFLEIGDSMRYIVKTRNSVHTIVYISAARGCAHLIPFDVAQKLPGIVASLKKLTRRGQTGDTRPDIVSNSMILAEMEDDLRKLVEDKL